MIFSWYTSNYGYNYIEKIYDFYVFDRSFFEGKMMSPGPNDIQWSLSWNRSEYSIYSYYAYIVCPLEIRYYFYNDKGLLDGIEPIYSRLDKKDGEVDVHVYRPVYWNTGFVDVRDEETTLKTLIEWDDRYLNVYVDDPSGTGGFVRSPLEIEADWGSYDPPVIKIFPNVLPRSNTAEVRINCYDPEGNTVYADRRTIIYLDGSDEPASPDYYNIPINDATGPRYRKIALNGRPMPDERPQDTIENDNAKEETYIDAFNLNLVHGVTDIYVPVNGSELALSLRRNLTSEVFCENSGLRPTEDPAKPFGACWSSNVCSYVKVVAPQGPDINHYEEPVRATVIDENGQAFSFVKFETAWLPMPTSSHEAKSFMTTLSEGDGYFLFRHKHGNVLRFEKIGKSQELMRDRVEGSDNSEIYSYARLNSVTDRLGYQLVYSYSDDGPEGLIPERIQACLLDSLEAVEKLNPEESDEVVGTEIPGMQIWLRQENNRVTQVWDPNGNIIQYDYGAVEYDIYNGSVGAEVTKDMDTLDAVTFSDGGVTGYAYEHVTEGDYTPKNPDDLEARPPYADPVNLAPCDSITQHVDYEHINLVSITDANEQTYTFKYGFDHSKETYVNNSVTSGYYIQTGSPRYVKKVVLPIGESTFELKNNVAGKRMRITASGDGYEDVALSGGKENTVTDAEGFTTVYAFEDLEIQVLKQFRQLYLQGDSVTRYKDPRILYYKTMRIRHGDYGEEVFKFEPAAGLALTTATDLSGNVKTYLYESDDNILTPPPVLSSVWPGEYHYYDDPVEESQDVSGVGEVKKAFAYDSTYRKMIRYTDPRHVITETTLDDLGRRQSVEIYSSPGDENPFDRVEYVYSEDWPGFVTRETHVSLGDAPDWSASVSTDYAPDAQGRVASEIRYPTANADGDAVEPLTSTYLYDYNGNLRLSTDPKGHSTGFSYDGRNRLTRTTYHDDSYIEYTYDERGNKVLEQDENGHLTGYQYDALNRRVKVVRDMNSTLGFDSGSKTLTGVDVSIDLVTENTYNLVNSLLCTSVADGPTTRYAYDGIQRVKRQSQLAAENPGLVDDIVTTFFYGENSGGSVFNVSGFKPTLSAGPRGYRMIVSYDERYQPVLSRAEYTQGEFAETRTVYDENGNPKSITDPLGHTTLTDYDALSRPTKVTFEDATSIETFYTSTGLPWKVTDEMGRKTTTEYDGAGRPIVVRQPLVEYIDESGSWQEAGAEPCTKTFYDGAGNVSRTQNPRGEEWTFVYDARNRQTEEHQPSVTYIDDNGASQGTAQPTIITTYDDVGNITSITDPRNKTTATRYDPANRPVYTFTPSVEYWDNGSVAGFLVTRNIYDRAGNITETWQGYAQEQSEGSG